MLRNDVKHDTTLREYPGTKYTLKDAKLSFNGSNTAKLIV